MSYILDALKKIEHEKKRKRPDGRISLAGDLFHERKQPATRFAFWKIIALIAAASLVTCAGTWFVLQGGSKRRATRVRPVVSQAAAPLSSPVVAPIMPANQSVPVSALPPVTVPVSTKSTVLVEEDVREVRRSKKQIKTQSITLKQPINVVPVPADIKLSGIAWQDDRSARRVVINGFLLKEGAVVSGAKITDIKADRVFFSSPAGLFEIKLDAVLPAEVK